MNTIWKLTGIIALIATMLFAQDDPPPAADPFAGAVPTPVLSLEHRLMQWGVPSAEFKDAALSDVIDFIRKKSEEVDPDKKGVNIILTRSAQAVDATVTLSLKKVSLKDLIEFTCTVAEVDVRFGANAVVVDKIPPMITKTYSVDPSLFSDRFSQMGSPVGGGFDNSGFEDPFGDFGGGGGPPVSDGVSLKTIFVEYGVPFPAGSSIAYEPVISQMIVRNTEENLKTFEKVLKVINVEPRQIEISGAFVEFTMAELNTIPKLDLPELASTAQLVKLREGGAGKAAPFRVVTINGVNAVVEDVEEIIYPTEFDMSDYAKHAAVIPGAFETREVGVILNVTPTVSPDNDTINLTLLPEQAELVREIDYGYDYPDDKGNVTKVPMKQPVFHSRNTTTSVMISNGSTVVVSGGYDQANEVMVYVYITARLIRADGDIIQPAEKK